MRYGVTLIELLVVVGIMLVLMAISISTLEHNLEDRRPREAASRLEAYWQTVPDGRGQA